MITLFPDQAALLEDAKAALRRFRRVLVCAATGFGKTVTFSRVAKAYHDAGKSVTITVHRDELVDQISATLNRFAVPHGIIAADYAHDYRHRVQVASVQTLVRRLDQAPYPHLVVPDEAHHCVPGSAHGAVLAHYEQARVLGFTATPERLDGQGLSDCFDDLVIGPQAHDLIPIGRLSDYVLFGPKDGHGVDVSDLRRKGKGNDYTEAEREARAMKPQITGDCIIEYKQHCPGAPAIIRCVSIRHSETIAEAFRDAGFTAVHIDGKTPKPLRKRMLDEFRRGEIRLLSQVGLFSEGFDVPGVVAGIDLDPTESLTKFRQFAGRTLRVATDKERAFLFDHAGNFKRHGLPDDPREWTLYGPSKPKDPDDVAIKQCHACGCVNRRAASTCRDCGAVFAESSIPKMRVVEHVDGALHMVDKAAARAAQGACATAAEMVVKLNYSEGRARHIELARAEKKALWDTLIAAQRRLFMLAPHEYPQLPLGQIYKMKPKALRETIDRVQETTREIVAAQRETMLFPAEEAAA